MGKALKTAGAIIGGAVLMATGVGALAGMQVTAMGIAGVGTMSIANLQLMSAGLMAAGSMLDKPKSTASGSPSEWTSNPDQGIPFLFGRMGVAGKIVHRDEYGPDNRLQGIVTIYSGAGPVKSFQGFTADELPVSFVSNGGTAVGKYSRQMWRSWRLGEQPDTALSLPTGLDGGAVMPMWGPLYKLSGKACDLLTLQQDSKFSVYPSGEPQPMQVLEGVYGYDPRYDDTYPGGAGPCRYGVRSTYRYIDNAIIAALNWALGMIENGQVVGGIGASLQGVDLPAFVEAANIADANAWTVAAWPDTSEDASVVLDELLEAGGAKRSRVAGKISCVSRGAPRPSIVTITRRDTAGAIELDTGASRFNRLNTITPVIMSEAHKWKHAPMDPVSFASLVTEDGGKRSDQIKYRFVSKVKQGAELAAYDILDAREPFSGTIPLLPHLRRLKPGDCFDIDEPGFMLDGVKMLVLSRSYDARVGEVRIAFRSETDSKHPLALGKTTTMPDYPGLTVPDPTEVTGPLPGDWTIVPRPPGEGGVQVPIIDIIGEVSNGTATAVHFEWWVVPFGFDPNEIPPFDAVWQSAGIWPPTVTSIPVQADPGAVIWIAASYLRGENFSERKPYGPITVPGLVSDDTTHLNGEPVQTILDKLTSTADLTAANAAAVADLDGRVDDTITAAEAAIAAGEAANLAVLKAGEAGDAAEASNTAAGIATTKADEAGASATAANAEKLAAEAARDTADQKAQASVLAAAQAEAFAGDAGDWAAASEGAAVQAAASAGEGLAYRNAAVDARDGAVAASQNAGVAASTAQISKVSTFPSRLDTDGSNFTTGSNTPVGTIIPLPASRYENVAGFGLVGTASDGAIIYHAAPMAFRADRIYRVRARVELVASAAQNARVYIRGLDGDYNTVPTNPASAWVSLTPGVVTEISRTYGSPTPPGGSSISDNTVWTRAGVQSQGVVPGGGKLRVYEIIHEDVTESASAANSAAAAITQAANASASAASAQISANLAASVSSRSGNLLSNTDFATTAGWTANVPLNINGGPSGYHPLGERVLTVTHATAQVDVYSSRVSVEAGKWYEVSAYLLAHRSQVKLFIRWVNAAGGYISSPETVWTTAGGGGNSTLADYTRLWLKAQAPAGAVAAVLMARKSTTQSGADSWMWMARPMLAETSATATGPALYTVGSGKEEVLDLSAQASLALSTSVDALTRMGQAAFELILASGGLPAYIKGLAEPGGTEIAFAATKLLLLNVIGDQAVTALELINGEAYFGAPVSVDISGRRLTIGPGFGVSSGLVLWFGPNTVSLASMSRTNGYFALGTDGKVYYGNAELGAGGGTGGAAMMRASCAGSVNSTSFATLASVTFANRPATGWWDASIFGLSGSSDGFADNDIEFRVIEQGATTPLATATITVPAGVPGLLSPYFSPSAPWPQTRPAGNLTLLLQARRAGGLGSSTFSAGDFTVNYTPGL